MQQRIVYFITPAKGSFFIGEKIYNLLTTEELSYFLNCENNKRKLDWLAGRIATKTFIKNYLNEKYHTNQSFTNIQVYYGEFGEPRWKMVNNRKRAVHSNQKLNITLAHTDGYAVASGQEIHSVGVDIERFHSLSKNVSDYFLRDSEIKTIKQQFLNWSEGAIIYWTLKEAALKSMKYGLHKSPKSLVVDINLGRKNQNVLIKDTQDKNYQLFGSFAKFDEFIVSVVTDSKENGQLPLKIKKIL